ncbi:hypothetical protein A3A95_04480 [Candidatus Nomurabacteria bacterium RIFCSPLOWO2_01_FULL_39_18]|uniref:Uncharacterized protein n=1 Tax=Candidatus Nomurabacteria bacterium RIFCSPHIGHO2_01_FULL_40_24b TaxID=1801739 RepID=A0A1F6V6K8_9BACT|nr:MAG: hypothetical protein A2647_04045 [Candidatus Nomurabacteria bacterium RIFCSPHIGHO2_01_FULL_40_24b]OGI89353.1 MAG: hypothetical protein A3A95_04480 [Candidatus Nomurabacteria bacterium RIFCSPLOWO2_01_FULL_39_18]
MLEKPHRDEAFGRIVDLDISPLEYYKLVSNFNLLIQHELTEKLNQNKESLGTIVTFITPGSDARLEKGSFMSPLEVIAVTNTDLDLDAYRQSLIEVIEKVSPTVVAKIIEMKGPHSSLVTAYNNRYQPGRIADSRLIYGSENVAKENKVRLGKEIINLRTSEVDKISSLKRDARKVIEKGGNRIAGTDAIHFDLQTGAMFYNPEAYQLSFKVGPLRLVQNTLLVEEIKHTRREKDANFLSTLDSSIVGRLNQLSDDQMINLTRESVEEVAEHYAFFLRLYHRSERAYAQNKQIVLQLTPQEITDVAKRLQALSALMEKFQIHPPKQSRLRI